MSNNLDKLQISKNNVDSGFNSETTNTDSFVDKHIEKKPKNNDNKSRAVNSNNLNKLEILKYRVDSGFNSDSNTDNLVDRYLEKKPKNKKNKSRTDDSNVWKKYYTQQDNGDTLLHEEIIYEGGQQIVRKIIELAPDPSYLDIQNENAEAPIHLAVARREYQILRDLLVAGCKPGIKDIHGNSALHIACKNGDLSGVKIILEPIQDSEKRSINLRYRVKNYTRMDLEQWNYVGQTCVHLAAGNGYVDIVRYLCNFGADINAREGLMGYTALHYAYDHDNQELIDFLTKECRTVDQNIKTYRGLTAKQLKTYESDSDDSTDDCDEENDKKFARKDGLCHIL